MRSTKACFEMEGCCSIGFLLDGTIDCMYVPANEKVSARLNMTEPLLLLVRGLSLERAVNSTLINVGRSPQISLSIISLRV